MRDVIRELHLFVVAETAVPWAKGSSWSVEGSSAASSVGCLSSQRELLPAGGWLSPAFFQNNVSKECFRWHNIYQAQYFQRDKGAKIPLVKVWRTSAPPKDTAGQASLPSYSKHSSAPEAPGSAQTCMQRTLWSAGRSHRHLRPRSCWAARQEQEGETHRVPAGSETHSTSAQGCHCKKVLRMSSTTCFEFSWKHKPPPSPPRILTQNFCTPVIPTKHWQSEQAG